MSDTQKPEKKPDRETGVSSEVLDIISEIFANTPQAPLYIIVPETHDIVPLTKETVNELDEDIRSYLEKTFGNSEE